MVSTRVSAANWCICPSPHLLLTLGQILKGKWKCKIQRVIEKYKILIAISVFLNILSIYKLILIDR